MHCVWISKIWIEIISFHTFSAFEIPYVWFQNKIGCYQYQINYKYRYTYVLTRSSEWIFHPMYIRCIFIRLYMPFSDWFGTKQTVSVWFQINRCMVNTIWFQFDLIRYKKDFSVMRSAVPAKKPCSSVFFFMPTIRQICVTRHHGGSIKGLLNITALSYWKV